MLGVEVGGPEPESKAPCLLTSSDMAASYEVRIRRDEKGRGAEAGAEGRRAQRDLRGVHEHAGAGSS